MAISALETGKVEKPSGGAKVISGAGSRSAMKRISSGFRPQRNSMSAPAFFMASAAAERVVHPFDPDRVGAPDDHRVRVGAGGDRLPDSVGGEPDRHQAVDADVVLDPPRQDLVLDLDALDAGRLRHGDGAVDVDRIAPAAAGVEHHRDRRHRADVDHDLDHLGQGKPGLGDALVPAERAAAER